MRRSQAAGGLCGPPCYPIEVISMQKKRPKDCPKKDKSCAIEYTKYCRVLTQLRKDGHGCCTELSEEDRGALDHQYELSTIDDNTRMSLKRSAAGSM